MWRLTIVTENHSVSVIVDKVVTIRHMDAWSAYESSAIEAKSEAEAIGSIYRDMEGQLVRRLEGWYVPEMDSDKSPESEVQLKQIVIAYRYIDVVGMSAHELP